jgi:hypothetical protein
VKKGKKKCNGSGLSSFTLAREAASAPAAFDFFGEHLLRVLRHILRAGPLLRMLSPFFSRLLDASDEEDDEHSTKIFHAQPALHVTPNHAEKQLGCVDGDPPSSVELEVVSKNDTSVDVAESAP